MFMVDDDDDVVVEYDLEYESGCGTLLEISFSQSGAFVAASYKGRLLHLFTRWTCAKLFSRSSSNLPACS